MCSSTEIEYAWSNDSSSNGSARPSATSQLEPVHVAGQRSPGLDLPLQLVDRRDTDAPPREHDGQQLGTGEIEHTLARPRPQPLDCPGQLEVAAGIERDDDAHDGLAAIPMSNQVAQPKLDALGPEARPPTHQQTFTASDYSCGHERGGCREHLDRCCYRRSAARARRRLRGAHGARHGRRRLHGLPSHRGAGGAGRGRRRVRPRHVERRAEQHRAPAPAPTRQVRRPHRPHVGRLSRPRAEAGAGQAICVPPRRPGPRRGVLAPAVRDGD